MQAEVKEHSDTLEEEVCATIVIFGPLRLGIWRTYWLSYATSSSPNLICKATQKELSSSETVYYYLVRGSLGSVDSMSSVVSVAWILCSILNLGMSSNGNEFGIVFIIMWGGSFIVTINTKLLGGHISFFQCVCVLGYCIFPIVLAAALIYILK
jgi:hypothetical protein